MTIHTVGDLAALAGITVRTLHHYDDIGLLRPSGRSDAGYRLYDDNDVERLRAILAYRELGLSLDETADAIEGNASEILLRARDRIDTQIGRLRAISASLTASLDNEESTMTPEEKLSVFGEFEPAAHEAEARERWGGTAAYEDASRRTSSYTAEDWQAIQEEASSIYAGFAALVDTGKRPDSDDARQLVDRHRAHISRWFYECTPQIHAGLGQMYATDDRFAENIDQHGSGVAAFMSAAIAAAYVDR